MLRIFNNYSKQKIVFAKSLKEPISTIFSKQTSVYVNSMNWIRTFVATEGDQKADKFIKSQYPDIKVIAGDDIYHLDRLMLAMKSDYFEKLLLNQNLNDQSTEPVRVPLDKDTFSALVDVIYGKSWRSILTPENYVSLAKAANLLQMKISKCDFDGVLDEICKNTESSNVKIFELYRFIIESKICEDLSLAVFEYLSKNLETFQVDEQFLSLPIEHVVRIISFSSHKSFVRRKNDGRLVYQKPYQQLLTVTSQTCAKWICYDIDNRLCHMKELVNAARCRFHFPNRVSDGNFSLKLSNIKENSKLETVQRYFHRWFICHAEIEPVVETTNEKKLILTDDEGEVDPSDDEKDLRNKLSEYLENGSFHDIVVKVEGKIYKLHRSILQADSGYFADICSSEYTAAQGHSSQKYPDKDKEYLIEGIDQTAFDTVIKHIYFNDEKLSSSNIVPVLKAAFSLKIDSLQKNCKSWAMNNIEEIDLEIMKNLLDFTRDKAEYNDLFLLCLKTCIGRNTCAETDYLEHICSIPWNVLEEWLMSSEFHSDNPHKTLDICSKWIKHDVKNRYNLLPQVALAVKCYGMPDYDDSEIETPADLDNLSEEAIRDKLWQVLSSTSLVPSKSSLEVEQTKKSTELPVFVAAMAGGVFHVLNGNCDPIATISLDISSCSPRWRVDKSSYHLSATMINDNLFIHCENQSVPKFFLVHNIYSNKFFTLNTDRRVQDCILNCRNELYSCCEDGPIMQYSIPLNRWLKLSKPDSGKKGAKFTSDGKTLYRLYIIPGTRANPAPRYTVDEYNFEQNKWISLSNVPESSEDYSFFSSDVKPPKAVALTIIKGGKPAILFQSAVLSFDFGSRKWSGIRLPDGQNFHSGYMETFSVIAENDDKITQVFDDKLYEYSPSKENWQMRKQLSLENEGSSYYPRTPYECIVAVHKPSIRTD